MRTVARTNGVGSVHILTCAPFANGARPAKTDIEIAIVCKHFLAACSSKKSLPTSPKSSWRSKWFSTKAHACSTTMLSDMVRQDLKGCAEKMVETFLCWKTI